MKLNEICKRIFCLTLMITVAMICATSALAVDLDGDGIDDDYVETVPQITEAYTEPVATEPIYTEEVTQPVETEPTYIEETTEYIEPTTEEAPTEYQEPTQDYVENNEPIVQSTTVQAPTIPKIVSNKKYSTSYTAGIVSWVCVGVGVLVVSIVLISNKVSGRKANHR